MGATERVTSPHVAILTVTTNAAAHLPAYFDALDKVTYPDWSLTVVDNASTDASVEIVRQRCPQATLLQNASNLGFTGACNRALEALSQDPGVDYILFLNDDTEVTPNFLEPLVARASQKLPSPATQESGEGSGVRAAPPGEAPRAKALVAPKTYLAGRQGILDDSAGNFDWWRGTWKRRVLGSRETPADNRPRVIDNANLSCLLVPRQAFPDVGFLDDAFFVYYDDTDFCRRARDAGYRVIYEPASVVYHQKGATLGGQLSAFGCYYLARNRPYLMRKHLSLPRFAVFFGYYLLTRAARIAAWLRQGRTDLVKATLAGVADFARGRMGPRPTDPKSQIRNPKTNHHG